MTTAPAAPCTVAPSPAAQAALDAPPVYRRMLAGGAESLRPGRLDWAMLLPLAAGLGVLAGAIQGIGPVGALGLAAGGVLAGAACAMLTTRWLGRTLGRWAGLAIVANAGVLLGLVSPWTAALAAASVGLFGLRHTPGRLPCATSRIVPVVYYSVLVVWLLIRGPAEPITVFLACAAYLVIGQDTRGLGRLLLGAGPIALAGAWLAGWLAETYAGLSLAPAGAFFWPHLRMADAALGSAAADLGIRLAVAMFPWTPLGILALGVGLRQGHHVAPIGRLILAWAVVPLAMALAGGLDGRSAVSLALPGTAVLAASGAATLVAQARRVLRYAATR